MSERLYSDIIPLLSNGDPKVRRHALERMIRDITGFDRKILLQVFGNAMDDDDEEVANTARFGLSLLFGHRRRRRGGTVGTAGRAGGRPEPPDDVRMRCIRQAAEDVLGGVLEELSRLALDKSAVEMGPYAVRVLGRFAFPDSLETLYEAVSLEGRVEEAVRALANFEDEEVLFLFEEFLSRFDDPFLLSSVLSAMSNLPFERVRAVLERYIRHDSAAVRASVAKALGKFNDDEAERLLLSLLDDPSLDVLGRAVDSLAVLGRPSAGPAVVPLTGRGVDKRLRSRAVIALGFIGNVDSLPALYALLEDEDHRVAANAVDSLARFDLQRPDIVRYMSPLLEHPNNRVRANAILLLHRVEEGRAMSTLRRMLQSSLRLDRASAAYCVGEIASIDAVNWLVTLINTELEASVLSAALNALDKLRRPEARPALNRLFRHPNATIRSQAVRVFSNLSDSSGMVQLESLFSAEKVNTVRSAIVSAMGNICDVGNFMIIARMLQDRNERVVANAVEALDKMGSLEITPFIQPFLKHQVNRIRANTIAALWKLGDLKVAEDLQEMLCSRSAEARRSAMHVLKQVSDFLRPALLAERPLLASALESRYRMRTSRKGGPVTEISKQIKEIFRKQKGLPPSSSTGGLVSLLRERALGDDESLARALDETLSEGGEDAFALFLKRRTGAGGDEAGTPSASVDKDELRKLWGEASFLPPLFQLLEESKSRKDLASFLADYLALFQVQADMYASLVRRARGRLREGDVAFAQQAVKFLVERMPLQPGLHADLAALAFFLRDHELAKEQYLRVFLDEEGDFDSALKLCSCAVRLGERELAQCLLDILLSADGVDDDTRSKAGRLKSLLGGKGSD